MPAAILDNVEDCCERCYPKSHGHDHDPTLHRRPDEGSPRPSPLWETVGSFGVLLHHHGRHTVHAPWATRARRVLPGTDLSALLAAMCVEGQCPDFLTPPPDTSVATFGDELERLRATPPEVVFEEVEALVRVEKELFGLPPEKERMLKRSTYLTPRVP